MNINYKEGQIDGQVVTYWSNGELKRQDVFRNGKLIIGKVWDSTGKEKHYDFLVMPEFPGGLPGLAKYFERNIKYPKTGRKKVKGRVIVKFYVNKEGEVEHCRIIEGLSEKTDAEVLRAFAKMPKWQPGMEDGEIIWFTFMQPLNFE